METIQMDYNPDEISYSRLLQLFFSGHSPAWASPIRQYASAIFYHDDEQEMLAREAIEDASRKTGRKLATELLPYSGFTRAEDYHQKYYLRNTKPLMKRYQGVFDTEEAFTDSTAAARVNGYIGGNGTIEQLDREASELGLSEEGVNALRKILRKKGR